MSLTLTRAIQSWRTASTPLYAVMLKHNIFYCACGLCESAHARSFFHTHHLILVPKVFSGVNVLASLLLRVSAPPLPETESFIFYTFRTRTEACSKSTHF